jgi:hypothetical protein
MTGTKYSKYFLNELPDEQRYQGEGKGPSMVAFTDRDIIEGSKHFTVVLMTPEFVDLNAHGPHLHRDPELLIALGTDPEHPEKLGGKIEMCMGSEMESHIFSVSTMVWIPAKFIHCPFRILEVTRPFLFIQCQYADKVTETAFRKLIPAEMRDKYAFFDHDGTQKD